MAKWGDLKPIVLSNEGKTANEVHQAALKSVRDEIQIAKEEGEFAIAARLEIILAKMEADTE